MNPSLGKIKDLIILGRMHFVSGGLLLYSLGYLSAVYFGAVFDVELFFYGYVILFFAHLSVSYSNDYFDAEEDRNSHPTFFSGGSGVLVKNPNLRCTAILIARTLIILSVLSSIFFVYAHSFNPLILAFVLAGNLLGYYYSAPPIRLSHRIYGGIALAATISLLVPGYGFLVAAKTITKEFIILSLPLIFYGIIFSIGVQVPDIESDRINKKINYASLYGHRKSIKTIALAAVLATASLAAIYLLTVSKELFGGLLLLSLIPTAAAIYALYSKKEPSQKAITAVSSVFLFTALADLYILYLLQIISL